jgi:hypothetical protein
MEIRYAMLFALLLVPFASAEGRFIDERTDALSAAMDEVICRTDFTIGVLESHIEHLDADELQENVDALESDMEELEELAESVDFTGFRVYMRETYSAHLRQAREDVIEARLNANITPADRLALRSDYDALFSDFQDCSFGALKRFATAKADAYEEAMAAAKERKDALSEKGLDTDGLESLINDAEEQVVDPFADAVDSAATAAELREALGEYCLFSGCPRGTNFHFAAKWHAEVLDKALAYVEDDAEEAGLGAKWDEASGMVEEADSAIGDLGTSQGTREELAEIWDDLTDASALLKEIISTLRSG